MQKRFPMRLLALAVYATLAAQALAVPITLFQDTDTYIQRAKDLVVAKCTAVPKDGGEAHFDGLHPVEVQVLHSLKGDRQSGPLKVATIYPLEVGKTYLLANTGGTALGTDFLSLGELTVVEIAADLDLKWLTGKSTKEQVQRIFAGHLHSIEQKLKPLLHAQSMLEKSLEGRTDNLFNSGGKVQLGPIETSSTTAGTPQWLKLGEKGIEWSHASPGKSGYLYFGRPGGDVPQWEFAASEQTDLKAFADQPLSARFYGYSSPGLAKALHWTGGSAITVDVGQIVLARTVNEPGKIYIIKIAAQGSAEAVTIEYAVVGK